MRKIILAAALVSLAISASAQNASPVGKWKTLDDKTGKVMTISEVYEAKNGTLAAKIVEAVGVPTTCTTCPASLSTALPSGPILSCTGT